MSMIYYMQFFIKYKEIQPTILTGWNVEFFDVTYLYNRAQQDRR